MRRVGRQVIIERQPAVLAEVPPTAPAAEPAGVPPVLHEFASGAAATDPPRLTERERRLFVFRAGSRRRRPEKAPPEFCLNCGLHVPEHHRFCGGCGQENTPSAVSFGELVREAVAEFVRIDSKLIKTLVPLLFQPGHLTQEYVAGKRVRYLSPFKMYVTVSALFFLSFAVLIPADKLNDSAEASAAKTALLAAEQVKSAKAAKAEGKAAKTDKNGKTLIVVKDGKGPPTLSTNFVFDGPLDLFGRRFDAKTLPASVTAYEDAQKKLPQARRDSGLTRLLTEKLIHINKNPGDAVRDLLCSTLPLAMLFLIPGYALLLKLFYLRSRRLYVEHLVFTLHAHTFLFLLAAPFLYAEWASRYVRVPSAFVLDKNPAVALLLLVAFGLYNVLALRRVYRQPLGKTLLKGFLFYHGYLFLGAMSAAFAVTVAALWTLLSP